MNERIERLFAQALDLAVPETYTTLDSTQLTRLKDKFAELIVKECLEQVDKVDAMLEDNKEKAGVAWVGLAIAKHFGVEE